MIASRSLRILSWCVGLASGTASAVGLGEINLHSRIGEPLRAEIPVLSAGAPLDSACFSLAPMPDADMPVIAAGRTRLVRDGQGYRLIITGSVPINEAVFMIKVQAGCDMDLQRAYVLLPSPPHASVDDAVETPLAAVSEPAPRKARPFPEDRSAEETGEASTQAAKPRPPRRDRAAATRPGAPQARATPDGRSAGQDKLRLGAAFDELPPPAAGNPLAPVHALEERMLKMETTLHLVNAQVDKLDKALALNAEARAMRQKLLALQTPPAAPGFLPEVQAAPTPVPMRGDNSADGWIELVLGVLLGGSVSATVAHLVSRRQNNSRPFEAPLPRSARPRHTAKSLTPKPDYPGRRSRK
jgi:pilus assembly protein FimV